MSAPVGTICFACKFLRSGWDNGAPADRAYCAAFPDGIPEEIIAGAFDHREPLGGEARRDGKPILFEMEDGEELALETYEKIKALLDAGG